MKTTAAHLANIARILFVYYLSLAVVYTFWQTTARPLLASGKPASLSLHTEMDIATTTSSRLAFEGLQLARQSHPGDAARNNAGEDTVKNATAAIAVQKPFTWEEYGRIRGVDWDQDIIVWHPTAEQDKEGQAMSEDFFLSKAFGESLQPSKVIPYYYRASSITQKKDITITTLVTGNRFKILAALVERYQGERKSILCRSTILKRSKRPNLCDNPCHR